MQLALFDVEPFITMWQIPDLEGELTGVWQPIECRLFCSHPIFCRHLKVIAWRTEPDGPGSGDDRYGDVPGQEAA